MLLIVYHTLLFRISHILWGCRVVQKVESAFQHDTETPVPLSVPLTSNLKIFIGQFLLKLHLNITHQDIKYHTEDFF